MSVTKVLEVLNGAGSAAMAAKMGRSTLHNTRQKFSARPGQEIVRVSRGHRAASGAVSVNDATRTAAARRRGQGEKKAESKGMDLLGGQGKGSSGPSVSHSMPPVAMGSIVRGFRLESSDRPQVQTDESGSGSMAGIRISGTDLMCDIATGATTQAVLPGGLFYRKISPAFIGSTRVTNLSTTYQFYAFRKIRFTYVPLIVGGSTAGGAIAFGSLHFIGSALTAGGFNTTGEVLQTGPGSVMVPVWQPATFEYTFKGTKLWPTTTNGTTDASQTVQGAIVACGQGLSPSGPYGVLQVDYVLDLYWPTQIVDNSPVYREDPRIAVFEAVEKKGVVPDGVLPLRFDSAGRVDDLPSEFARPPLLREEYATNQGQPGGSAVIVRKDGSGPPPVSPAPAQASAAFRR
jgi:hypothetical protein